MVLFFSQMTLYIMREKNRKKIIYYHILVKKIVFLYLTSDVVLKSILIILPYFV